MRNPMVSRELAKSLASLAFALVVTVGLARPPQDKALAQQLEQDTSVVASLSLSGLVPGFSRSQRLVIANQGSEPLGYRLVLVRSGLLWGCDPGDNNLTYRLTWSPGADRYLLPGEVEVATLQVGLPLAAGNDCQGAAGTLFIRRGWAPGEGSGGVYQCELAKDVDALSLQGDFAPSLTGGTCTRLDGQDLSGSQSVEH